ncbi:RNA polymerase sigma factor [soil metagenome]
MDEQTLVAARRGDRRAQATLIRDLQDVWFRFSLSQLGNPDLAADAAQETALRFLRDLKTFRGASSIKTWSLGISLNVIRELRRKRKNGETSEFDDKTDDAPSPLDTASSGEQVTQLRALLADLPERQRESVILRFFENLSVDETAKAMNVAPGTIKATIHQALRSLKNKLSANRDSSS